MKSSGFITGASTELSGVLDQGCSFEGKLCFHGTLRINGDFKGEIFSPDTLVVGPNARITGEVDVGVAIISGEVNGKINARHRAEIRRPAVFKGDIVTSSLSVEEGVIFEGSSKMAQPT